MQRVESRPAMTAPFAGHGVSISTFPLPSLSSSPARFSVLPVALVSMISLGVSVLLSILARSLLVLTSPAAGSLVSGGAGLTGLDTRETLGG